MCIRDRVGVGAAIEDQEAGVDRMGEAVDRNVDGVGVAADVCLLYTSDAADERSSVDLGGRRIIKKKNQMKTTRQACRKQTTTQ